MSSLAVRPLTRTEHRGRLLFDGIEAPEPHALPVAGRLPPWLAGTLLRTGPALFTLRHAPVAHWFDGLALLHSLRFGDGRAVYRSRFLRSEAYRRAQETGRPGMRGFATDPPASFLKRVAGLAGWVAPDLTDNANVSVVDLPSGPLAMTEVSTPYAVDPDTLEVTGRRSPDPNYRPERRLSTAHPIRPAGEDAVLSFNTVLGRRSHYEVFRTGYDGGPMEVIARVPADNPSYMHSFSAAGPFVILVEPPLRVNPLVLALSPRPFIANYRWRSGEGSRVVLIDRRTGGVRFFETEPFLAFHHVNAFRRGDVVCIDLIAFRDASVIGRLSLDAMAGDGPGLSGSRLLRLEVDPSADRVRTVELDGADIEFPALAAPAAVGSPYEQLYAVHQSAEAGFPDALVRIDLARGPTAAWREPGCCPGEPVYVAAPGAVGEGEGVVLSLVLDRGNERSFVVALDGRTLGEVARLPLPHPVPPGLHGCFIPD